MMSYVQSQPRRTQSHNQGKKCSGLKGRQGEVKPEGERLQETHTDPPEFWAHNFFKITLDSSENTMEL